MEARGARLAGEQRIGDLPKTRGEGGDSKEGVSGGERARRDKDWPLQEGRIPKNGRIIRASAAGMAKTTSPRRWDGTIKGPPTYNGKMSI